jgi:hypothetical protein
MPHQLLEPSYLAILDRDPGEADDCPPREMIAAGIMLAQVYRDDNERWMNAVRSKEVKYDLGCAIEKYERMANWAKASKLWLERVRDDDDGEMTHQLQESIRQLTTYVQESELMIDPRCVA